MKTVESCPGDAVCPPPHLLVAPSLSTPGVPQSLAADDPTLLARKPGATVRTLELRRGERERPPWKRPNTTLSMTIIGSQGKHRLHISVGHRPDGTVREFFVDVEHREGAPLRAVAHVVAASNSLALQYGAPLRSVCSALRVALFEPAGDVKGHPTITHAHSLCDLVAQVLEDEDVVLRAELAQERARKAEEQAQHDRADAPAT